MKKNKFMDVALILIFATLVVFTTVMIVTFWRCGSVPDTLIMSVFGALTGECGLMALIKNTNTKYEGGMNNGKISFTADDY